MNIQIFGTKKSQDTKKAERYFKERGIKFQAVDMKEKGISKGELQSVLSAVGDLEEMLDEKTKDLEHPMVLKQPIVRNGKQATVGYCPDIWKTWE